jgi:hypothetical protein
MTAGTPRAVAGAGLGVPSVATLLLTVGTGEVA